MDERVSQFFLSVGKLCDDARIGRLTVRLILADGAEVTGVPAPPLPTNGAEELNTTGYADAMTVGDVAVALSDVVEASIVHPAPIAHGS